MARCKQYFMEYESDKIVNRSNIHTYGRGNTIKTCKQYISRVRQNEAQYNPRNFRIYDSFADIDPETDFVPVVYSED